MDRKEGQTLFEVTPEISHFAELCEKNNAIDKELYTKYEVKRGLRDLNGKGVLAGLTNISDVCAKKIVNGEEVPCAGNLYYRGYNIKDLVQGFLKDKHYGFEEIAYLLLFGELPDKTINKFSGGRQYVSGNRCERGIGKEKNKDHIPNLYEYRLAIW